MCVTQYILHHIHPFMRWRQPCKAPTCSTALQYSVFLKNTSTVSQEDFGDRTWNVPIPRWPHRAPEPLPLLCCALFSVFLSLCEPGTF